MKPLRYITPDRPEELFDFFDEDCVIVDCERHEQDEVLARTILEDCGFDQETIDHLIHPHPH